MKTLILLFLLSVIAVSTEAQFISNYGIKLGVGISNQSWNYKETGELKWDNKTGISPRIFADFFNISFFQLEGEMGYLRKGFQTDLQITTTQNPEGTGDIKRLNNGLDYFTISISGKLKYELKYFIPFIIAGPQLNILVNKDVEKGFEVVFDKFKKSNVGMTIGAGMEVKNILPGAILLEYRYETDFSNNYDSPNIDIKNYSHVFFIGIIL